MTGGEAWRYRWRTAEAMALTAAATAVRRVVAFPRWRPLIGSAEPAPPPLPGLDPADPGTLRGREREVAIAVSRAHRRLPYDPRCLDRATAGQLMLRWRGQPGTVVIGLAPGEAGSAWGAHAWLAGTTGVLTGGPEARDFTGVTGFRPPRAPDPARLPAITVLVSWVRHALAAEAAGATGTGGGRGGGRGGALPPATGVDTAEVVELARRQRLCSLLMPVVDDLPLAAADRAALATGRRAEAAAAMRVALSTARAIKVLQDAGIRALALKGVALAMRTTGDLTARGGGDVDLLVAPEDVPRAHAALLAAGATAVPGYVPEPGQPLWPAGRLLAQETPYLFDDTVIDLHWRPDPFPEVLEVPFGALWSRRVVVRLAGTDVPTLSDDDALLFTLTHGLRDRWLRLRSIVDAVRQLRAGPSAPVLRARARTTGCLPALGVGLQVTQRLMAAPVVPGVRPGDRARRAGDDCWWAAIAALAGVVPPTGVVTPAARGGGPAALRDQFRELVHGWWAELAFGWRMAPGPRTRMAVARKALLSPQDLERWPLPPALLPAYAVGRPLFGLARKHFPRDRDDAPVAQPVLTAPSGR